MHSTSVSSAVLAAVLLGTHVIAGPNHGHFHKKRVLDIVTDWDVVYDTVTDVVWVTVTGGDGAVTTLTTPAVVAQVPATTTSVQGSVDTSPAVIATSAATATPVTPSNVASSVAIVPVVSSVIAPVSSSVSAIAVAPTSTSSVAPVPTTLATIISAPAPSPVATTAAAAASTPAASTSPNSSSKRGLSYNEASLLDLFTNTANINWCYNWGSAAEGTVPSDFEFVPMLWGLESSTTDSWNANAKAAIADGATTLLAFNEPDNPGQSNISPADAAAGYIQYMNPLSGSAQLGAPAVTNGGGSEGLQWLEDFISACDGNCDIDFVPIHWYDSATNFAYFKSHVEQAYVAGGNRTLWITEFGCTSGTTAEQVTFLEVVMPWLDQQEYVARYAYFMDDVGVLLQSVSELSDIGTTFMDYTSTTINSLIADV